MTVPGVSFVNAKLAANIAVIKVVDMFLKSMLYSPSVETNELLSVSHLISLSTHAV